MRVVLVAVYARLSQALPRSFALRDGPIVLLLRVLDWECFEAVAQVSDCVGG